YFVDTYLKGKTPNPCLFCNKEIKFGTLLDEAKKLGADFIATGHYAKIVKAPAKKNLDRPSYYLAKGKDAVKDQSYFLSLLSSKQLGKIIFPLSDITKSQTKALAQKNHLHPLGSKESQDICFINDGGFARFIIQKQGVRPQKGDIVDVNGKTIGVHDGLHQFTVGQRKGINCPAKAPYYVKEIDMKQNRLVVCFKDGLSKKRLMVKQINWNYGRTKSFYEVTTKIRYNHKGTASRLYFKEDGVHIEFEEPQYAVTPGQAAVFYKGERVLGAGIIQ
ncbi:MAG: tRNA 2-thiouridine(34) synthase MnmA, partial [Desulfobacteraceae bacterium]|nr:tRNA 2-thiouridine(34) synthase MnmA [Desulfobacteraceae bacterium]